MTSREYPAVVGIYSSRPRSGKSTVARHLIDQYGYVPVKFAKPLKDMTRILLHALGIPGDQLDDWIEGDLKESSLPNMPEGVSPRSLMQTMGTDWGRMAVDQEIWIKAAKATTQRLLQDGHRVVIDDMRFPNEFDAVGSFEDSRRFMVYRRDTPDSALHQHVSEGALDGLHFDEEIFNDSTVAGLNAKVDFLMRNGRNI